ncbi:hypothetical protein SK128_018838, partial [Halocaridina rubra]
PNVCLTPVHNTYSGTPVATRRPARSENSTNFQASLTWKRRRAYQMMAFKCI